MTPIAILAIIIAVVQAATFTLPVTQDFAVVNQDRIQSVIARNDVITLFNNGLISSISYYGIDTTAFIQEASITTNSPVSGMIDSATLVFKDFTILSEQTGAINIHVTALNPGQNWNENTVTLGTTPTIKGSLGDIDFSTASPSVDVTNLFVEALTAPYQGSLFGFQIGLPGGPVSVPSHRSAPGSIVLEIEYSPLVGPGGTAPQTSTTTTTTRAPTTTAAATTTTTTTRAPATTTTTSAPINCWTCGAGWIHWYEVPGATPQSGDPCACVPVGTVVTTTTAAPGTPSTTAAATTTTTSAPGAPSTAQPQTSTTTSAPSSTSAPNQPERNSAEKITASALMIAVAGIALLL